ncbi:MAG: protein jag [Lachnospiraceae bacterium]|nr:protein jag [Lachnospiraceae bacterium]
MGKTVEEAVSEALSRLSCTAEELEYNVVDEGKSGFLGLGSKPAEIEARKKETVSAETVSEVKEEAKAEANAEVKAETSDVLAGDVIAKAEEFLNSIFANMGISAKLESSYDEAEKSVDINIVGDDMGNLIGKRGQTLDSLQYLTSLVVNKNLSEYVRVKLDTENYRARRKETLENLAKNIAYKVKRTKRAVKLEPMNPYERRIIHSALQDDKYVYTKSEGEEPFRHVVVLLKREKRY